MNVWVVGLVGCIECGVPSGIFGVFTDKQVAKNHLDILRVDSNTWDIHGGDGFWYMEEQTLDIVCPNHELITKGSWGEEE